MMSENEKLLLTHNSKDTIRQFRDRNIINHFIDFKERKQFFYSLNI